MIAAPDHDLPALTRAGDADALGDTRLFSLIGELKNSEKRRDELLDRLSVDGSAQVERFKIGRLPPVPPATGIANRADIGQATPPSF